MSVKLIHELNPELNGKNYSIIYTEANQAQQVSLDKVRNDSQTAMAKLINIQGEFQASDRAFVNNQALLELNDDELKEQGIARTELLVENRGYLKKLETGREAITSAAKNAPSAKEALEKYHTKRFELLVSGVNSADLKELVKKKVLTFTEIFSVLEPLIKESKEKK